MLVSFFSSNIPLYIGKNPVEKLCKVLEMELKTYTPVGLKFDAANILLKLNYLQSRVETQYGKIIFIIPSNIKRFIERSSVTY